MSSYKIPFTYTSQGELTIEADSQEEAEEKAQQYLDKGFPTSAVFTGGEGEVA